MSGVIKLASLDSCAPVKALSPPEVDLARFPKPIARHQVILEVTNPRGGRD